MFREPVNVLALINADDAISHELGLQESADTPATCASYRSEKALVGN